MANDILHNRNRNHNSGVLLVILLAVAYSAGVLVHAHDKISDVEAAVTRMRATAAGGAL